MTTTKPDAILFLSDARGHYIPQHFAENFSGEARSQLSGVKQDDLNILLGGPDQEHYDDVWCDVLDHAIVTDDKGRKYTVYQDGDCWLLPEGIEISDSGEFYWPEDDAE